MFSFSKPGILLTIVLMVGLTACISGPAASTPKIEKSPIPTGVGIAKTEPSEVAPVLNDSATMHISRVIPLGEDFPFGLVYARQSVWVLLRKSSFQPPGTILRIDPDNGQITGEPILVDFDPWSFAVTDETIWVAKNGPQNVLRIDPDSQQVLASLDINAMLVTADARGAWVSSGEFNDSRVYQIDPLTNRVKGDPIPVGIEPIDMVTGLGAVWVGAHSGPPAITRIDPVTGQIAARIEVGFPVHRLAVGPDSVWAVDYHEKKIVRISPKTNQIAGEPILLPFHPYAMAVSETDAWVGVSAIGEQADPGDDRVARIDLRTNTIVDTIHVGGPTIAMVFADGSVWIATQRPNQIVQLVPAQVGSKPAMKTCVATIDDGVSPSYKPNMPERTSVGKGHILRGTVRSSRDCAPIAGAMVELWPEYEGTGHPDQARATIYTDENGAYTFESDIPEHIHLRISADGFRTIGNNSYHPDGKREGIFDIVLKSIDN